MLYSFLSNPICSIQRDWQKKFNPINFFSKIIFGEKVIVYADIKNDFYYLRLNEMEKIGAHKVIEYFLIFGEFTLKCLSPNENNTDGYVSDNEKKNPASIHYTTKILNDYDFWHKRFGYLKYTNLQRTIGLMDGLKLHNIAPNDICGNCIKKNKTKSLNGQWPKYKNN